MIDLILIDELIVKELCQLILSYATLAESSNLRRPIKNDQAKTPETLLLKKILLNNNMEMLMF
jgi:hypothetical protein